MADPHQAINGGNATYFGINVPFDLNTLLGIVSVLRAAALRADHCSCLSRQLPALQAASSRHRNSADPPLGIH